MKRRRGREKRKKEEGEEGRGRGTTTTQYLLTRVMVSGSDVVVVDVNQVLCLFYSDIWFIFTLFM